MRCGVCHTPLHVRGYRNVEVSRGTRRVPLYRPCPNLDDPARHPARRRSGLRATPASPQRSAPFPRGARLRFMGTGPLATRLAAGTEIVVRSTCATRSLFEHGDLSGAIWPEHAAHWQIIDPKPSANKER